jgi:hypothetical protein
MKKQRLNKYLRIPQRSKMIIKHKLREDKMLLKRRKTVVKKKKKIILNNSLLHYLEMKK